MTLRFLLSMRSSSALHEPASQISELRIEAPNLKGQRRRLMLLLPIAVLGGLVGGLILLRTGEGVFTVLVPWMILAAALLLAIQNQVKKATAIYGGFFSAGMRVLLLAVMGLTIEDSLTRLNALKQLLEFAINISAAILFLGSGPPANYHQRYYAGLSLLPALVPRLPIG